MKNYIQGMIIGSILSISIILFIAADKSSIPVGRYQYYISHDDISKKHNSRIFDTATGVVYHKLFSPGSEKIDIKWVNGEKIEKKYFRPDLTIWKSETWEDYRKSFENSQKNKNE